MDKLAKLMEQEKQLRARIAREKAKLSQQERKQRTGRLVAWGVAVEQLIESGSMTVEEWETKCRQVLQGRTLEKALNEPLQEN
jgi:hypothetical protein